MACPVCMQCGSCGKKIEKKIRWKPGMCPICKGMNPASSSTCARCGASIPPSPGVARGENTSRERLADKTR